MATGPEHYKDAERCLDMASTASDRGREVDAEFWHREANVHALLAVAAAVALPLSGDMNVEDCDAWELVASGARRGKAADQ